MALATSVIRTFKVVPIASGIVQAYVKELAKVEAVITTVCSSSKNAFLEYSSLTLANEPVLVQVMLLVLPTIQISVPFGAATVTEPLIVKLALDRSETVESATLVIRTFTVAEILSGMVQA